MLKCCWINHKFRFFSPQFLFVVLSSQVIGAGLPPLCLQLKSRSAAPPQEPLLTFLCMKSPVGDWDERDGSEFKSASVFTSSRPALCALRHLYLAPDWGKPTKSLTEYNLRWFNSSLMPWLRSQFLLLGLFSLVAVSILFSNLSKPINSLLLLAHNTLWTVSVHLPGSCCLFHRPHPYQSTSSPPPLLPRSPRCKRQMRVHCFCPCWSRPGRANSNLSIFHSRRSFSVSLSFCRLLRAPSGSCAPTRSCCPRRGWRRPTCSSPSPCR